MKSSRGLLLYIFSFVIIGSAALFYFRSGPVEETARMKKMTAPNDHFFTQRTYPDLIFDHKAYVAGLKQASSDHQLTAKLKSLNTFPGSWTTEGPGNIGGRINCVAVHPTNQNIIFAGNAAGGIFRTTDGVQPGCLFLTIILTCL